jgi:uroporphyrin-III C-methyltransferase/precorrin-2 dehydrogenase/sirohydrochlorin ferrochelatase
VDFFPLFADLHRQPCLIVGGGSVAARKARALAAAGAAVTVNAPEFDPELTALDATGAARLVRGPFDPALIGTHLLVIAATSDPAVNRSVAECARAALRLCNVVDDAAESSFIVPGIVDRSPLVVAVSSGGRAPVLARMLRQQIERWLPTRLGALARFAGDLREDVRRRLPGLAVRRDFWERLLAGPAAERVLAGDEAQARTLAAADLARTGAGPAPAGKAWLVGAGPGDPGLIYVRGLEVLQQADVVLHDRLVAPELLRAARRDADVIGVGKAGGAPSTRQEDIERLLVEHVRAGRKVCRLKGGDPLVFGRGGEEALALARAGLPFEIVPGITAATGCGGYAGIPLTHRGIADGVSFVTASLAAGSAEPDWARLAGLAHTLVVYMGGARVADVAAALLRHGRAPATPVALVTHGTTAAQRVLTATLGEVAPLTAAARGLSPALLIVGDTVALAASLGWRDAVAGPVTDPASLWPAPAALAGHA